MRPTWIFAALLLAVGGADAAAAQGRSQPCSVVAQAPGRVSNTGLVSGTATLPPGGHLWVLARMKGWALWWPQGGGPAVVRDGRWTVLVTFGVPGQSGTFEVAVVVVGAGDDQNLRAWVANAAPPYTPIPLPNTLPGCPMRTLVVQKVPSG